MNLMVSNFFKNSFITIVCGNLKLNQKRKKKKNGPAHEDPPINPVKPAGKLIARELLNFKPVKPAGKPVAQEPLNFKPVKPTGKPVGTGCMGVFEFI